MYWNSTGGEGGVSWAWQIGDAQIAANVRIDNANSFIGLVRVE
jgi:hypothetical protein